MSQAYLQQSQILAHMRNNSLNTIQERGASAKVFEAKFLKKTISDEKNHNNTAQYNSVKHHSNKFSESTKFESVCQETTAATVTERKSCLE